MGRMPERQPGRNAYAAPNPRVDGSAPNPANDFIWAGPGRYSVSQPPESTDPEYTLGFSPALKSGGSPDGSALPDDIRVGHREPPATRGTGNYNEPNWQNTQNAEHLRRHSVEQTEEMWKVRQERVPAPRMPIWEQERAPIRPTANNSPTGYAFRRPWHIPRNRADVEPGAVLHFSMADHRRKYEIMGLKPQGRLGVNTYRAAPRPWDQELYIAPPAGTQQTNGGIAGNRNWRL